MKGKSTQTVQRISVRASAARTYKDICNLQLWWGLPDGAAQRASYHLRLPADVGHHSQLVVGPTRSAAVHVWPCAIGLSETPPTLAVVPRLLWLRRRTTCRVYRTCGWRALDGHPGGHVATEEHTASDARLVSAARLL